MLSCLSVSPQTIPTERGRREGDKEKERGGEKKREKGRRREEERTRRTTQRSDTSVMIIIVGASLSEQHTDLLICHCTKQDLSRTSRYLGIT